MTSQLRNRIWDEAKERMLAVEYAADPKKAYEFVHNIVQDASEQADEEQAFSYAMRRVEELISS